MKQILKITRALNNIGKKAHLAALTRTVRKNDAIIDNSAAVRDRIDDQFDKAIKAADKLRDSLHRSIDKQERAALHAATAAAVEASQLFGASL